MRGLGDGTDGEVDVPGEAVEVVDEVVGEEGVVADDENGRPTTPEAETAIWGSGESNSLVVVLRAIFTWRLDEASD